MTQGIVFGRVAPDTGVNFCAASQSTQVLYHTGIVIGRVCQTRVVMLAQLLGVDFIAVEQNIVDVAAAVVPVVAG